ncbi:hypothetical protein SDRG_04018 [Saprolegnia diclina VS20]|uniref:AB hydrolase-1 domain-containing protein n=1 Tax=Saprolegnia diclina (strain VS20) TaxID=1156394 RepID=T0S6C4_SAPDV|nr:hypothetical protein SDRG_04018 [Saprolegnia diclina VS20]EQC38297.1 hypothetical protein SDRG_04018 [Saprolegnia diclina VS20]|eukprot:XP_008607889.1 hypothetical protein SDRG_04018 [Saprolegnia diclina VS20]
MGSFVPSQAALAAVARPVLVTVHDVCGRGLQLLPLEAFLGTSLGGKFGVRPFRFDPNTQRLQESGLELVDLLHTIKPYSSMESCYFVTHGYGALVLREAFRYIDWDTTRTKIVMLAPPNRGCAYYSVLNSIIDSSVAIDELSTMSPTFLDARLGKLPKLCRPMILAGSLSLNPWNQWQYPTDGVVSVDETHMPGEYQHFVVNATHHTLPYHPMSLELLVRFLRG